MSEYKYRQDAANWASDDQWECCELLRDLFGGFHHMRLSLVKEHGYGIAYSVRHKSLATFDNSQLTRLVFLAHDRMVRVEIEGSGPGMFKLCLWKRHKREGSLSERHPTAEKALEQHRINNPS